MERSKQYDRKHFFYSDLEAGNRLLESSNGDFHVVKNRITILIQLLHIMINNYFSPSYTSAGGKYTTDNFV